MSIITEDSLLDVFLGELREKGLKAQAKPSYVTLWGKRIPDARIVDGGEYLIEADVGEKKLGESVGQIYDYLQLIPCEGGFSVIFPEKLRDYAPIGSLTQKMYGPKYSYLAMGFYRDPARPPQQHKGSLNEVLDWLSEQVLAPPARVEYDVDLAVRVVKSIVERLREYIQGIEGERLVEIFGGKSVFDNILQYEEKKYPLEEMRRAAGYLLVNQILFYHVLSKADPSKYKEIDHMNLSHPAELRNRYFTEVLDRDFTPTFGFDVSSIIDPKATQSLSKLVAAIKALEPHKAKQDILGQVFQRLIPLGVRKALAAFYTNPNAAELLANLAINAPEAEVMDLAVGSGTLLVAAYRRKKRLLEVMKGRFAEEDHKRFLEEHLTGIDIMPFAAHLAVVHLSLQGLFKGKEIPVFETEKVRTAIWDSTDLRPGTVIPEISRELKRAYLGQRTLEEFRGGPLSMEYLEKGAITAEGIGGRQIPLRKVDLIMMNPPFTRQERLPKEYKNSLDIRLNEYQEKVHRRLGLHGYFVLLADRFLKPRGRLALVLPATILRLESATGIRKLLADEYRVEHIVTTRQRAAFSEGAQFREILLVAQKNGTGEDGGSPQDEQFTVTIIKKLPGGLEDARNIAHRIRNAVVDLEDEDIVVHKHDLSELNADLNNWFNLIATEDKLLVETWKETRQKGRRKLTTLSELIERENGSFQESVRSRKGGDMPFLFVCRTKDRAIKKHDVWILKEESPRRIALVHRFLGTEFSIPRSSIVPGLRRASGVKCMDVTSFLDSLIVEEFPGIDDFLNLSPRRMKKESIGEWREYVMRRVANVAPLRRFDLSASGTNLLAFYTCKSICPGPVLWSIYLPDDEQARILTVWLNSSMNLLQILLNRSETRGAFIELGKYMLGAFEVVDPARLKEKEKRALLNTFSKQKDVTFTSLLEQLETSFEARKNIDKTVLKILGFDEEEISGLLAYLYPALYGEILRLKELMAG